MSLTAADITVKLGPRPVLRGVSLTAQPSRLTAIIGPNGSGKTTLLRALTAELRPVSGRITLNGADMTGLPPDVLALRRAVLPQHSALSFPFTAAEIIRIGLTAQPQAQGAADALIGAALAQVGLPDYGGRLYQEMSGGEQQRVQLARALVQVWHPVGEDGPRWLLLDEPVSSLDIAHQLAVMRLAAGYARRGGGVIAVMHDLNLTAMFADHVLLMQNGCALAEGPPDEVLTDALLTCAYNCPLRTRCAPSTGAWLLPQGAMAE
ncbi:MAG: heme ABC transporter ATP-binding protein [Paracoccus sp. (in: a-proteobacteria)]|uniref:heme ABC transporter ATP-binding protein n=1 Tax=Paracoccus sp. TaxID=267 RepID=UPI0026DF00DF|nr:heme ABC transporter ATP-binding protein [Paracoccus sp. (in: a-proteobacteria)]MDO5631592.1 heme ABC transporter ATP-binding protein [Paracoccus sp. (in: a-proteobacteria)]